MALVLRRDARGKGDYKAPGWSIRRLAGGGEAGS